MACMHICVPCAHLVPLEPRNSVGYPKTGVTEDYGQPYGFWELDLCPLQRQSLVLLSTEQSLQLTFSTLVPIFLYLLPMKELSRIIIFSPREKWLFTDNI